MYEKLTILIIRPGTLKDCDHEQIAVVQANKIWFKAMFLGSCQNCQLAMVSGPHSEIELLISLIPKLRKYNNEI